MRTMVGLSFFERRNFIMKPLKEAKDYSGQLDAYQKNHALQIEEYPEANLSFMGFPANWQAVLSAGRYSAR